MQITETLTRGQPDVFAFPVEQVEGHLPAGLDGVLFRNGAGQMQIGDDPLAFLDGYGMVAALEIAGGRAWFRSAYVETDLLAEERRAGRMTRRRVFTNLPQRWKNVFNFNPANPATHDSYVWNGQVYATDLGGHWALSLPELKTTGTAPWGVGRGELVAPMPRDDPRTGTLVCYALTQSPSGASVRLIEVDEKFDEVASTARVGLKGLIHDVAFTELWYVLIESAGKPRPLPAVIGSEPLWSSFGWKDVGPTLVLIPRGRSGEVLRIPLDTSLRTVFHVVNAHDDGDDIVVDVTGYEGSVSFDLIMPSARGRTYRPQPTNRVARIRASASGTASVSLFDGAHGEAPEVAPSRHGQEHSWAWFAALPADDSDPWAYPLGRRLGALRVSDGQWAEWDAGQRHHVSPPGFAPDPAADDPEAGWILAWDLDLEAETTDVVVLDAQDVAAGPIARIPLGIYLPAVSHCRFAPGARISS